MRAAAATTLFLTLCFVRPDRHDGNDVSDGDFKNDKAATTKGRKKQPHIIFILIDDQGFNDIGYHNPSIKTPTLDKLAAEGVKLENYYVQPICTPSRSQLLTGRYQIHTGLQHSIIRPSQPSCLPPHMDTLPQRLRQAGYATHMVGKWHLGFYTKECLPTRKGFDSFFGSLTGSVDYYSYGSCDGPGVCGYDLHANESVAWGHQGKYSTTLFTQQARKIIQNHDPSQRPIFLLLSLQGTYWEGGVRGVAFVHSPLLRRRRRVSKALIHITDWFPTLLALAGGNVSQSQCLDGFDVWGAISEGQESPRHEILHNIDPLHKAPEPARARQVPESNSVFKKPKKTKRKKKQLKPRPKQKSAFKSSKKLNSYLKARLKRPKARRTAVPEDNLSLTPAKLRSQLKSKPSVANAADSLSPAGETPVWDTSIQAAIRVGDWKLLTGDPGHGEWVPLQVLPTLSGRWWNLERAFPSLQHGPITEATKSVWLFNISADPYERHDLSRTRPDVVRQLLTRLGHYNRTAVPVFFPPDDPRAHPDRHGGAWVPWMDRDQETIYKKKVYPGKKKKKNSKCRLCKLKAFFLKLNTGIMSSRITDSSE
ncbi:arylsulfatase I-like isoform X2 [Stigmatopora nigra]